MKLLAKLKEESLKEPSYPMPSGVNSGDHGNVLNKKTGLHTVYYSDIVRDLRNAPRLSNLAGYMLPK